MVSSAWEWRRGLLNIAYVWILLNRDAVILLGYVDRVDSDGIVTDKHFPIIRLLKSRSSKLNSSLWTGKIGRRIRHDEIMNTRNNVKNEAL